jgi:hypothetical protein
LLTSSPKVKVWKNTRRGGWIVFLEIKTFS